MNIALIIFLMMAGLAALAGSVLMFRKGSRLFAIPAAYLGIIAFTWATVGLQSDGYYAAATISQTESTRPVEKTVEEFVSSDTCRSCHPGEYHSWHKSYHRTMTQLATEESVRGDFENGFVGNFPGLEVSMKKDGENFLVNYLIGNPQGVRKSLDRRVVMTTGSHHYQVYWTDESWVEDEKPGDKTAWLVPFVYHFEEQRWLPRYATFITPPIHLPENRRWNQVCSRCHSTHGAAKYDPVADIHTTQVVEFGISCEACHGPGKEHIEANRNPLRRYGLHRAGDGDDSIVNPAKLNHRRSAEVCGRCHSNYMSLNLDKRQEWNEEGQSFRPGDVLSEHLHIHRMGQESAPDFEDLSENYLESRFWPDGMARVAGREYNGLLESPCFQRGEMSCLSCHDMHKTKSDLRSDKEWANDQLGPEMRENAACTQCHESFGSPEVLASHTHHLPDSAGSNCYNCHMPHTSYGLLKGIRSHQIDSPSVKTTIDTGRPNACNLCHLDQTLAWTAKNLNDWYSQTEPELDRDQTEVAASLLWLLKGDAGQRALIASAFARKESREVSGSEWMTPFLAQLQNDPYDAVQIIANRTLRTMEGYEGITTYPGTRKAGNDALRIWEQTKTADLRNRPALLLDAEGKIKQSELDRILKMRDDSPIHLSE